LKSQSLKNITLLFLILISFDLEKHAQIIIKIHENNKVVKTEKVKNIEFDNLISKQLNQLIKNGFLR